MKMHFKSVAAIVIAAGLCAAQDGAPEQPQAQTQAQAKDNSKTEEAPVGPAKAETPPVESKAPAAVPSPSIAIPEPPPPRRNGAPSQPPVTEGTVPQDKLYVIGPNDVLYVRVWGNSNLTGMVNVGPDGMMPMPLIGPTKADGLTLGQLTDLLRSKLINYVVEPEVTVDVTRSNSKKYFIMGEGAGRPGEFPLNGPTTISEALAISGGFRDFANTKKIYILRKGGKKLPFNYKDFINGKHPEQDVQLENGDKIVIPQ